MKYTEIFKVMEVAPMGVMWLWNHQQGERLAFIFRATMAKTTPPKQSLPEIEQIKTTTGPGTRL